MATDPGYVIPKPGIPKTLGILNIIFGVLSFLFVGCAFAGTLAAPALMQFAEQAQKQQATAQEEQKAASLKALDEREKTETSDEQKAAIAKERDEVNARPKIPAVDMSAVTTIMNNKMMMGYNIAYMGTGVLLCLLLLISGIALVRLAKAGRPLANTWAVLQIAHIVLFTAISVLYVQPAMKPVAEKMIVDLEAQAKAGNAPPQVTSQLNMARAMQQSSTTIMLTLMFVLAVSVYPVICLILLNTAGARAAFPASKPGLEPEF